MFLFLSYILETSHSTANTVRDNSRAAKFSMLNFLSLSLVSIIQTGHHHHHRLAPLSGASTSSGALYCTNNKRFYAYVIPMQSSFRRRQALISGLCDQHLSYSHQKHALLQKKKINQIPYIP